MSTQNTAIDVRTSGYPLGVWLGWLSSLCEAYNMGIYSFTAPLLAPLMFAQEEGWSPLIFSYGLSFLAACFFYPAGALYYGLLADTKGRRKMCSHAGMGLSIATGLMGLIPFGVTAEYTWGLFLLMICVQHFFSGGEYHGSVVFSLENADTKENGILSSLSCLFAVFGIVMASAMALVAGISGSEIALRCCFLAGGLGGVTSYYLRSRCAETLPLSEGTTQALTIQGLWTFLLERRGKIARAAAVLAFFLVSYSYIFFFLPLVFPAQASFNYVDTLLSLIEYGILLVMAGYLADRFGIARLMRLGAGLFATTILPLAYLSESLLVLQLSLTLMACLVIGPIHSWLIGSFAVQERCRGIFISSAIATSLFLGSTVPLCLLLFEKFNSLIVCSLYPMAFALAAWISIRVQKDG